MTCEGSLQVNDGPEFEKILVQFSLVEFVRQERYKRSSIVRDCSKEKTFHIFTYRICTSAEGQLSVLISQRRDPKDSREIPWRNFSVDFWYRKVGKLPAVFSRLAGLSCPWPRGPWRCSSGPRGRSSWSPSRTGGWTLWPVSLGDPISAKTEIKENEIGNPLVANRNVLEMLFALENCRKRWSQLIWRCYCCLTPCRRWWDGGKRIAPRSPYQPSP